MFRLLRMDLRRLCRTRSFYIILGVTVGKRHPGGAVASDEIGLPVEGTGMVLPCGATAIWRSAAGNREAKEELP